MPSFLLFAHHCWLMNPVFWSQLCCILFTPWLPYLSAKYICSASVQCLCSNNYICPYNVSDIVLYVLYVLCHLFFNNQWVNVYRKIMQLASGTWAPQWSPLSFVLSLLQIIQSFYQPQPLPCSPWFIYSSSLLDTTIPLSSDRKPLL